MKVRAGLALATLVFAPSLVFAHAELVDPPPRGICQTGSTACKQSPCGLRPAGAVTAELIIGSNATITWRETIDHPGFYELRLSTNGEPTGRFPWVLTTNASPDVQGGTLPREYGTTFTVPATQNCNPCILQLVQVMTENPSAPVPYFNCADIRIAAVASSPTPTPTATATPTPTPGNPGNDNVSGSALCSVASTGSLTFGTAVTALLVLGLGVVLARRRR